MFRKSLQRLRFAVGISAVASLLMFLPGPAQAVQVSTLQYEGYFNTGGNLTLAQIETGAWTQYATCCVLGDPDQTQNIVDANSALLGHTIQVIGDTRGTGTILSPFEGT